MSDGLPKLLPVFILLTTYNRLNLLKKTIDLINDRTFYPFRILVIDNNSSDGTGEYLRYAKLVGKIYDAILMPENVGQSKALNEGFAKIELWENELRRPSSDFFVTTNDDIYPPMLGQDSCWLTQMIDIFERSEPEFGGLCMRIQRTPRNEIDESKEIIECYKGFPSVFRLLRRSDFRQLGDRPFGHLRKWDSNTGGDTMKMKLKKKFGFTTHIYADHAGFMPDNRGYGDNKEYFTYAENKEKMNEEKPYPDIDPETNEPTKINHTCDIHEQRKREEYKKLLAGERVGAETTIIVLTCKRLTGLKRILDSIGQNTEVSTFELLVVADNDDTEAYNYCLENGIRCILSNARRDFTAQANLGAYACETPYFVIMADDMEVTHVGWLDDAIVEFKEKFPDGIGIMCFDDGIQHGRIFTSGVSSKRFIHYAGGHMYYPRYVHYGGDNELSAWTKHVGKYHYAEKIKVNHYHPTNKKEGMANPDDDTYRGSEPFNHQDQMLKRERKSDINKLAENKNYHDYF
jgi:hypothetical protein